MPASMAQKMVSVVMNWESIKSAPIVVATATPHRAPRKLVIAPRVTAWRGVRTRVPTTVAMALAAS